MFQDTTNGNSITDHVFNDTKSLQLYQLSRSSVDKQWRELFCVLKEWGRFKERKIAKNKWQFDITIWTLNQI